MNATRNDLNLQSVIAELIKGTPYSKIAEQQQQQLRETFDRDVAVSRGLISGVARDLKNGKLLSNMQQKLDEYIPSYRWGVDPDNGGIPLFISHPNFDGDAVVVSDVHAPKTDIALAESVNKAGRYYGVKTLIIAGDLFDGSASGRWARKVRPATFQQEISVARQLVRYWYNWFDRIIFEPGNHDDWFLYSNEGHLGFTQYAEWLTYELSLEQRNNFIVNPYDRLTLVSSGIEWTIPHQAESSVTSLKVGEQLTFKFETNVVVPHQHNTAQGYDRYRRYVIVDIGGLHNAAAMDYVNLKTSTAPVYDNGYVVLVDGGYELIAPDQRCLAWRRINKA